MPAFADWDRPIVGTVCIVVGVALLALYLYIIRNRNRIKSPKENKRKNDIYRAM